MDLQHSVRPTACLNSKTSSVLLKDSNTALCIVGLAWGEGVGVNQSDHWSFSSYRSTTWTSGALYFTSLQHVKNKMNSILQLAIQSKRWTETVWEGWVSVLNLTVGVESGNGICVYLNGQNERTEERLCEHYTSQSPFTVDIQQCGYDPLLF